MSPPSPKEQSGAYSVQVPVELAFQEHMELQGGIVDFATQVSVLGDSQRFSADVTNIRVTGDVPRSLRALVGSEYQVVEFHASRKSPYDPVIARVNLIGDQPHNSVSLVSQPSQSPAGHETIFDVIPAGCEVPTATLECSDVGLILDELTTQDHDIAGLSDPRLELNFGNITWGMQAVLAARGRASISRTYTGKDYIVAKAETTARCNPEVPPFDYTGESGTVLEVNQDKDRIAYGLSIMSPTDVSSQDVLVEHFGYRFTRSQHPHRDRRRQKPAALPAVSAVPFESTAHQPLPDPIAADYEAGHRLMRRAGDKPADASLSLISPTLPRSVLADYLGGVRKSLEPVQLGHKALGNLDIGL